MNEPFTFRPSDAEDPRRGDKFEAVLNKRGANPTFVLRKLIDAYIETDGIVPFPVRLQEAEPQFRVKPKSGRSKLGTAAAAAWLMCALEVFS